MKNTSFRDWFTTNRPLLVKASKWFFLPKFLRAGIKAMILFSDVMIKDNPEFTHAVRIPNIELETANVA